MQRLAIGMFKVANRLTVQSVSKNIHFTVEHFDFRYQSKIKVKFAHINSERYDRQYLLHIKTELWSFISRSTGWARKTSLKFKALFFNENWMKQVFFSTLQLTCIIRRFKKIHFKMLKKSSRYCFFYRPLQIWVVRKFGKNWR